MCQSLIGLLKLRGVRFAPALFSTAGHCYTYSYLLCPLGEEVGDPLTNVRGYVELGEFREQDVWDGCVERRGKVHKQDSKICQGSQGTFFTLDHFDGSNMKEPRYA